MQVEQLVRSLLQKRILGDLHQIEVTDITADSRSVKPGSLFLAIRGYTVDGHRFVTDAKAKGAVAAIVEEPIAEAGLPQIVVPDTRKAAPILASQFYGNPTQRMKVIGVTGTNGKTTTTTLIDKILSDYGKRTGLIGTIKTKIGTEEFEVNNTTPEAVELQQIFFRMLQVGTEYPVMEVSSHGLDMGRVAGIQFHTAVFTNLTQDHLDYHKTMEEYREAKGKLFSRLGNTYPADATCGPTAVLNADDPASAYFARLTAAQVLTYGIDQQADVRAEQVQIESAGTSFRLISPYGEAEFHLKMTGKFSVYNALAAVSTCLLEGMPLLEIKHSLEEISGVNGRFERVMAGQPFQVIVDYSHTPDSLENALKTIKEFAKGRIITVVGCGGDRDRSKRPIMAKIAVEYSDLTVLTSDNPRTEDPEAILDDMEEGIRETDRSYTRITDRAEAIRFAVSDCSADDVVLIAGKGHETYQQIGKVKYDFDDRVVATRAIRGIL